jgi:integral membrane sensor domain MASE1
MMAGQANMVDKVSSQFRLNRFLPSCLEIKSMRDSLVSGAVVAGLPLATVGVIVSGGLCAILGSCRLVTFRFF